MQTWKCYNNLVIYLILIQWFVDSPQPLHAVIEQFNTSTMSVEKKKWGGLYFLLIFFFNFWGGLKHEFWLHI
jgi:hypothetical protein